MAQARARSRARPKARDPFWLDHLRACREQRQTLKAYAQEHGLSVSALYSAHSTLKRRGVLTDPAPAAPTFVPVRIPTVSAAFRVSLPNGVEPPRETRRVNCLSQAAIADSRSWWS